MRRLSPGGGCLRSRLVAVTAAALALIALLAAVPAVAATSRGYSGVFFGSGGYWPVYRAPTWPSPACPPRPAPSPAPPPPPPPPRPPPPPPAP
ncbi:MAG: hypothetical protein K6T75_07390, partial [Acetobacteraceae bacterium]|nr:hypothetical protein [Acetobacteraceae bacterium]